MKRKNQIKIKNQDVNLQKLKQLNQEVKQSSVQFSEQSSQKLLKQFPEQVHKKNVLLIIIIILFFIAVLIVLNQQVTNRENIAQKEQITTPYIKLIVDNTTQQKVIAIADISKEAKEEKKITEIQIVEQKKELQKLSLDEGLSAEYNEYFLGDCKDSDGGKNFYEAGTTVSKTGTANNDVCNSNAIQYPNRLYEYSCDTNQMGRKMTFECPNGCKDGSCA